VKKVIELLEQGLKYLDKAYDANNDEDSDVVMGHLNIVEVSIKTALKHIGAELKALPRWETPEQYENRTGEEWPEKAAVYVRVYADKFPGFGVYTYADALRLVRMATAHTGITGKHQIACATEAGPPPDDWRPEEEL
jgi:hypothetical protein